MTVIAVSWTHRALPVPPAPSLDSPFLAHFSLSQDPNCCYMLLSLLPSSPTIVSFFLPLQCCHSLGWDSDWRLQTGHSDSSPTLSNTSSLTRVILPPGTITLSQYLSFAHQVQAPGFWALGLSVNCAIMPALPLPLALFAQPNRTHFWFPQHLSRVSSGVTSLPKPFLTCCVV